MRFTLFLALLLILAPLCASEAIYKKVHPDGTVEFTDTPTQGSQEIPLERVPTTRMETPRLRFDPPPQPEQPRYQSLRIASPADDETLRDNEGNVSARVALEPELSGNHSIRWRLDGQAVRDQHGLELSLTDVDRGTHTLVAEVLDEGGQVLISSTPVTFHLQRFSILLAPPNP